MGDRANVIITGDRQPADLILYTHHNGYRVADIVREGIKLCLSTGRNTDGPYASRLIVDTFFRAHAASYEDGTGAGIYVGAPCEAHQVWIDLDAQTVTDHSGTYPFAIYVTLDETDV